EYILQIMLPEFYMFLQNTLNLSLFYFRSSISVYSVCSVVFKTCYGVRTLIDFILDSSDVF
ncbi:MAG: hypothetical protein JXB88_05670, partial [Spirochaetales bacterium]|nr:hypothetical protein [Spirochaetales bacterium]